MVILYIAQFILVSNKQCFEVYLQLVEIITYQTPSVKPSESYSPGMYSYVKHECEPTLRGYRGCSGWPLGGRTNYPDRLRQSRIHPES